MSPSSKSENVKIIISEFRKKFNFKYKILDKKNFEKKYLELNSKKIFNKHKLKNYFSSKESIKEVVRFYDEYLLKKKNIKDIVAKQINTYERNTKNF